VPDGAVMVTLKIASSSGGSGSAGFQSFRGAVPANDRLLNLLHYVGWYLDGTPRSGGRVRRGVRFDAMRINGVNWLACKVLIATCLKKL
jgi:succinate dehydrogenase / fumarate reductase iron-sulfur subunit